MRLFYWIYRRSVGVQRWLVRRLTPAGGFVLAGLGLASTLVSNPGQTVAYQAFAVLGSMLMLGLAAAPFFRVRVVLERRLPRFATVGELLRYRVVVTNLEARAQVGLEYLEEFRGGGLTYEAFKERLRPGRRRRSFQISAPLPPLEPARVRLLPLPPLLERGRVAAAAEVVPLRRGPLYFAGARLARPDPLGLVRALRWVSSPGTVMVLPRRYPVPARALPGSTQYQHGGVTFASGVGESEEFVGVREYRRGDSLRRVHWRVSARLGRPVVREYQDEFFVRHALVLDTFGDASTDGLFEEAVSVAASFAWTVPDQDSLLDLLFVGPRTVCVTAGRAVGHTEQMLEVLACVRPCREQGRFADLEDLVLRHSARVSGCILVLLEWDETRRGLVRRLRALGIPVWALVVVPAGSLEVLGGGDPAAQPDRLVRLEAGRIEEGLRAL